MTNKYQATVTPHAASPRKTWVSPQLSVLPAEDAQSAPIPGIGDGSFSMGS